jgi:hypothetical protein
MICDEAFRYSISRQDSAAQRWRSRRQRRCCEIVRLCDGVCAALRRGGEARTRLDVVPRHPLGRRRVHLGGVAQ